MSEDWPAWAIEPVEIVPSDPAWPRRAARLIDDLRVRLAQWLDGDPEHVGSTAVPGLAAKPTVDVMAPVRALGECAAADEPLAYAGWKLVPPELDGRPYRRFYVLPDGDRHAAHLHLMEGTSDKWREVRAFRDALREDAVLAELYEEVKREAARAHPRDREAYTRAKTAFVARVLAS